MYQNDTSNKEKQGSLKNVLTQKNVICKAYVKNPGILKLSKSNYVKPDIVMKMVINVCNDLTMIIKNINI